ncbi:MAG: hypothetical protein ACI8UO_004511 [Verrucomicrobiales bacterium]|jgi:hypothetical protein
MPWVVSERKIGRAGGERQRLARQQEWDRKYGDGLWAIGYVIEGEFVDQERAVEEVYNRSYAEHFAKHPEDLEILVKTAKMLRNPHSEATTGVDLQVPAIMAYLGDQNLTLEGDEVVDIGTWKGQASHTVSVRLSPLHLSCCIHEKWTLEKFWQERKVLAVWEDDQND